jgi:hypothetical protein
MLVRFTIDGGCIPVREQAREDIFDMYVALLRQFDPVSEGRARLSIQDYLASHTEFTASRIACTGDGDGWHEEFEPLYTALEREFIDPERAHEEAGKFLGLLVWNEALNSTERWHFTKYPKLETDLLVTNYFAMDGHICANAKERQADSARRHGNEARALDLAAAAEAMRARFRRA